MAKSRSRKVKSSKRNILKSIKNTTSKVIPIASKGLKNVGTAVVDVTKNVTPVVEKGLGTIYGTLNTGFNLGVKGIRKGISFISKKNTRKTKRSHKNKSRRHK